MKQTFFLLSLLVALSSCGEEKKPQPSNKDVVPILGSDYETRQRMEEEQRLKAERDSIIKADIEPFAWGKIKFGISMNECAKEKFVKDAGKPTINKSKDELFASTIERGSNSDIYKALNLNFGIDFEFFFLCDELCQIQIENYAYGTSLTNKEEFNNNIVKEVKDDCDKFARQFERNMGTPKTFNEDNYHDELKKKGFALLYIFNAGTKEVSISMSVKHPRSGRGNYRDLAVFYNVTISNTDFPKNKEKLDKLREEKERKENEVKAGEYEKIRETLDNGF